MTDCRGLWRRTLLIDTDGTLDRTTDVRWLQGLTRFVDLRRPTARPDFGTPITRTWQIAQTEGAVTL